jgi:hypothetical protein
MGNLSWVDQPSTDISGTSNDTELLFNSSDAITGSSSLTWDGSSLDVTGDITSTGDVSASSVTTTGKGSVTQTTSVNTGVTVNASSGKITTVSLAIPSHEIETFTVTNSSCSADSIVLCNVISYGGTYTVTCSVNSISAGSFDVVLSNPSGGTLDAAAVIGFMII